MKVMSHSEHNCNHCKHQLHAVAADTAMEQFFAPTLDAVARRTRRLNAIGGQKKQLSSEFVEIDLLTVKHTMA